MFILSRAMTFETERLLFRDHESSDLDAYCEIQADGDFRRYIGGGALRRADAERKFQQMLTYGAKREVRLMATVFKPQMRYIGYCGLHQGWGGRGEAVLAFYIARPYWGQGLATEAGRAFIEYGFNRLGLDRILASAEVDHAASICVLEKLGFRQTGIEPGARSFIKFELTP
jgi:[ribosomal protein S5]-alanine N-acetyltransferase